MDQSYPEINFVRKIITEREFKMERECLVTKVSRNIGNKQRRRIFFKIVCQIRSLRNYFKKVTTSIHV